MEKRLPETCWVDLEINKLLLLRLVGFLYYFTYIDDARSNTNQTKTVKFGSLNLVYGYYMVNVDVILELVWNKTWNSISILVSWRLLGSVAGWMATSVRLSMVCTKVPKCKATYSGTIAADRISNITLSVSWDILLSGDMSCLKNSLAFAVWNDKNYVVLWRKSRFWLEFRYMSIVFMAVQLWLLQYSCSYGNAVVVTAVQL